MSIFQDPGFDDPTKWETESNEQGSSDISNSSANLYLDDMRSSPSYASVKQIINIPTNYKFSFNYISYSPWNLDAAKVTLYIDNVTVLWELPLQLNKSGTVEIDLSGYSALHTISWKITPLHFGVGLSEDYFKITEITEPVDPTTHNLDLIVQPWSWYTPNGAVDAITQKLGDINGIIVNIFSDLGIIDYQYVGTEVFQRNNEVIIRIKLKYIGIESMGFPLIAQIGLILAAIFFIVAFVGKMGNYTFNKDTKAFTNEDLTSAGAGYMKYLTEGIVTKGCSDPTLTQDQKVDCIKNNTDNALEAWENQYQNVIYPDADHTALENARIAIQACYDTYQSSEKSESDYQNFLVCTKNKREEGINKDKEDTLKTYDPEANAGAKEKGISLGQILLYGGIGAVGLYLITKK